MRRAEIEAENRYLLMQQHQFRLAADVVTDALVAFPEVEAVAVIGSVAKAIVERDPAFSGIPPGGNRGVARVQGPRSRGVALVATSARRVASRPRPRSAQHQT